jgi:hypothetical protein
MIWFYNTVLCLTHFLVMLTIFLNLPTLKSQAVWDSMQLWKYPVVFLLGVGTMVTFSYSIPDGRIRRSMGWLGRINIHILYLLYFWAVEISMWIWSLRLYEETINGNLSLAFWFCYGFTPILSFSCLAFGFGIFIVMNALPGWILGCSALGVTYYYLAAAGLGQLCVLLSCVINVGLLLYAPQKGYLSWELPR